MRDTFMKVAQSMMVKKQLVAEKGLKEKMIHSVMPPKVAEWLMRGHVEDSGAQLEAGDDVRETRYVLTILLLQSVPAEVVSLQVARQL